jgi:hypothetical protein
VVHVSAGRYRLDVAELRDALNQRRARRGITWAQVSAETGLAAPLFCRLADGRTVSADTLVTLLKWLGGSAGAFTVPAGPSPNASADETASFAEIARLKRNEDL